jgi:hypothetical protein
MSLDEIISSLILRQKLTKGSKSELAKIDV